MDLQILDYSELYFPRKEWRWLRPSVRYSADLNSAPDSFVWAAHVQGKLWAWHPRGADIESLQPATKVRVLVLKTDGSELQAHGLYLKTAFTSASAQDVEWVSAIQVLIERFQLDLANSGLPFFWKEALEASGLEPHLGVLAQRSRYVFLTDDERQLIFDRRWDMASLELLETMNLEVRKNLTAALRKWNLSANQSKEAANYVLILFKKLGEKAVFTVLGGNYKNAEEFRLALLRTAQPELAVLSQKRIDRLRALHMPPRTSVFGDPSFEKDVLKITHTPRTTGDFEAFKDWVMEPGLSEKIRELLEIYQ